MAKQDNYTPQSRNANGSWQGRDARNNYRNEEASAADRKFSELQTSFKKEWITQGADEQLITIAESIGVFLARKGLTNSKIRSIYGEIKRIQMGEFEKEKPSFYLLRPKVAYAVGRDDKNDGLKLFKKVFDYFSINVTDQRTFQNFCNLLEAILAYHRANGGKD